MTDKIEEIIEEFSLSEREVEECKEMLHQDEFRDRIYRHSEDYATVFYDAVCRYIDKPSEVYA